MAGDPILTPHRTLVWVSESIWRDDYIFHCGVQLWPSPSTHSQLWPEWATFSLFVVGFCLWWTELLGGVLLRWLKPCCLLHWSQNLWKLASLLGLWQSTLGMSLGTLLELLDIYPGAAFLVMWLILTRPKVFSREGAPVHTFTSNKLNQYPCQWLASLSFLFCWSTIGCFNFHFCNYQLLWHIICLSVSWVSSINWIFIFLAHFPTWVVVFHYRLEVSYIL